MRLSSAKKIVSKNNVKYMCVHEIESIRIFMNDMEKETKEELLQGIANTVLRLNKLVRCISTFEMSYPNFISKRDFWYYCMKIMQIRNQFVQECEYRYSIEIGDYDEHETLTIDELIINEFKLQEIFDYKYSILAKGKFSIYY